MKTKLFFIALLASTFINAQSIEFTSDELTTAEIGSTVTVDYKYTIAADGYIYCAIELLNDWAWSANVASAELTTAAAGTDVTGSFDLTIPNSTTPTADLTGNLNYKLKIELKQNPNDWLAGAYPATQIDLTAPPTASVNGVDSFLNDVKIYPNPARDFFQITNFSKLNNPMIKIYNMLGKELYSTSSGSSTIDISNFTNGVYLLKINSDGLSKTIQFVKF